MGETHRHALGSVVWVIAKQWVGVKEGSSMMPGSPFRESKNRSLNLQTKSWWASVRYRACMSYRARVRRGHGENSSDHRKESPVGCQRCGRCARTDHSSTSGEHSNKDSNAREKDVSWGRGVPWPWCRIAAGSTRIGGAGLRSRHLGQSRSYGRASSATAPQSLAEYTSHSCGSRVYEHHRAKV